MDQPDENHILKLLTYLGSVPGFGNVIYLGSQMSYVPYVQLEWEKQSAIYILPSISSNMTKVLKKIVSIILALYPFYLDWLRVATTRIHPYYFILFKVFEFNNQHQFNANNNNSKHCFSSQFTELCITVLNFHFIKGSY